MQSDIQDKKTICADDLGIHRIMTLCRSALARKGRTILPIFPPFPNPGLHLFWIDPRRATTRDVFFDEDRLHVTAGGQLLACVKPGSHSI